MSNPMPDLLSKAIDVRNAVQRMMASLNLFAEPHTQDLEQTLSFEFFYQRRDAFGRRGLDESSFAPRVGDQSKKKH
jgi:hypothetical protein